MVVPSPVIEAPVRYAADGGAALPLLGWLEEIRTQEPEVYGKCLQRILLLAALGSELRRPLADILRDGIYELRIRHRTVNYRILYFFCGRNIVCLSHGFTKKARVPAAEIETAIERKQQVLSNLNRHTGEWTS